MTDASITAIAAGIVAIIAAIPPTLVAYAALKQSQHNAEKSDQIIGKADQIHTLTNSNLSAVTKSLEIAQARIDGLEKLVAANTENKRVADALAAQKIAS